MKIEILSLFLLSPSSRRAWIEILDHLLNAPPRLVALLAEGVDRNIDYDGPDRTAYASPSSRRAWIEITLTRRRATVMRSPSSRRAWIEIPGRSRSTGNRRVALLAEGVDRNSSTFAIFSAASVALLAEGVDRNTERDDKVAERNLSPSSRRAWIEIVRTLHRL